MIYKINISANFVNYVESIDYEKMFRKNLICFLLNSKNSDRSKIDELQTEYREFYIQFELVKEYIENVYLSAYDAKSWKLDYATRELIIDGQKK